MLSVQDQLRRATATIHRQLESKLPLMSEDLSVDLYAGTLKDFLCLYTPLEQQLSSLEDFTAALEDWGSRVKVPKLVADLADLCGREAECENADDLPLPRSTAQAFGAAYVMEGATLGGQFISRRLKQHLGIDSSFGGRFFSGYGPLTAAKWKRFVEVLESQPRASHEEIVRAGVDTFEAFHRLLGRKEDRSRGTQESRNARVEEDRS